jgi:hypothetical protein
MTPDVLLLVLAAAYLAGLGIVYRVGARRGPGDERQ